LKAPESKTAQLPEEAEPFKQMVGVAGRVSEEFANFQQLASHVMHQGHRSGTAHAGFKVARHRHHGKAVGVIRRIFGRAQFYHLDRLVVVLPALLTLGLNHFLQLVPGTADGETLVVQKFSNAANHQHLMVLVIAAIAPSLHGSQLRELLLPVPQYMGLDAAQIPHLSNGEVAFGRNRWERFFHENQGGIDRTFKSTLTRWKVPRVRKKSHQFVANGMFDDRLHPK
jgi:hypothetical protein